MLASPLPPSFLDTYILSLLSLGCKGLCIVISFLVLWFICLSSSFVHFSFVILKRGSLSVCLFDEIPVCFREFFRSSDIFYFLSCLMASASNISKFFQDSFCPSVLILSWFGTSFLSVVFFCFACHIFLCQIQILYPDYTVFLFLLESPLFLPFLQTTWCQTCTLGG